VPEPRPKPRWGEYAPEPAVVPGTVTPPLGQVADQATGTAVNTATGTANGTAASTANGTAASASATGDPAGHQVGAQIDVPVAAPALRPRRTWDIILTTALLALAVYDVIGGYSTFANLAPVMQSIYDQLSIGQFASTALAAQWGLIANIARIAILLLVVLFSLRLVSRRRLAFWVPLAGGALAVIVVLACFMVIVASDPAYLEFVMRQAP